MSDLPPVICDYLCQRALANRRPAYLRLDRMGTILEGGGHLAAYQLNPLATGQPVSTIFDFMEGMLPLEDDTCHLSCLQPQADACIDAHLITDASDCWLLLLDMGEEERRHQEMQQKANELVLLREYQARRTTGVSGETAETNPVVTFEPEGDRKVVTVLAVGLRPQEGVDRDDLPADVLNWLAFFRRRLIALLQAEAGLIYVQTSDILISLFGLLPTKAEKTTQALAAALKVVRDNRSSSLDREVMTCGDCYPAIGVATGTVIVGLGAVEGSAHLQAVGPPIMAAVNLQQLAAPGQILIDRPSFEAARGLQKTFDSLPDNKERNGDQIYAYIRKTSE